MRKLQKKKVKTETWSPQKTTKFFRYSSTLKEKTTNMQQAAFIRRKILTQRKQKLKSFRHSTENLRAKKY